MTDQHLVPYGLKRFCILTYCTGNTNQYQYMKKVFYFLFLGLVFQLSQADLNAQCTLPLNLPSGDTLCPGGANILDGGVYATYLWSTGETTRYIAVTSAGMYTLTVSDAGGSCTDSIPVTLQAGNTPAVSLGPDLHLCGPNDSVHLDGGAGYYAYLWPDATTDQDLWVYSTANLTEPIWVEVHNSENCPNVDTLQVTTHDLPVVTIGSDFEFCFGDTVVLDAGIDVETLAPYAAYLWNSGPTTQMLDVTTGRNYRVTVTTIYGCVGVSNIVVATEFPLATPPVITLGDTAITSDQTSGVQWYYSTTASGTFLLDSGETNTWLPLDADNNPEGYYAATYTNSDGCTSVLSNIVQVIYRVTQDDIPQGFSPNGDGRNDNLFIHNIQYFQPNSFILMNRYGMEVRKIEGYMNETNAFDGKNKSGDNLPDGTYYYILDLENGETPLTGYLVIHR